MYSNTLKTLRYFKIPEAKNGERFLEVTLAGRPISLPLVNVSSNKNPVYIAYLDPRRKEIMEAGALEIAARLTSLKIDLVVSPSSDKSTKMIQLAVKLVREAGKEITLLILTKGKPHSEEIIEAQKMASYSTTYSPITAKGEERIMILTTKDAACVSEYVNQKKKIAIVDDVYSMGKTVHAIKYLVNCAVKSSGEINIPEIPVITVMRECDTNSKGELEITDLPNLHTSIVTPVIKKALLP